MPKVIKLKPLSSWEQAQRTRAKLPAPLRVLTSLKTTAVLGATLGALLNPALALKTLTGVGKVLKPKSIKGAVGMAIGIPTAYGVLSSSAKARTLVKTAIDPREAKKRGEFIGGMIEDPDKIRREAEKRGWKTSLKEAAKKGGKFGLIGAGVLGVGVATKKFLDKRKTKEAIREVGLVKNDLARAPIELKHPYSPLPTDVRPQLSPIGQPQATKTPTPIQNIIQIQLR